MNIKEDHVCDFTTDDFPENAKCIICGKSILADVVLPDPPTEKPLEFEKYRSIHSVGTDEEKEMFKNLVQDHGFDDCAWVVLNKYHGANLQIMCSADDFKFFSRKLEFDEKSDSLGLFDLANRPKYIIRIAKEIQMYYGCNVSLFFEYFGGAYPHPNAPTADPSLHRRIQKGVFYCPHNDIRLIDIKADGKYIDYDEFKEVAERYNIRTAKELKRGSFYHCLDFDPVFEDPTYKDYNLPKIEDNFSEGVVLKPVKNYFFKNGKRCILKNKNPKFKEKQREPRKLRKPKELTPEVQAIVDELSKNITENRLNNILSHQEVKLDSHQVMPNVIGLMTQDILKEEHLDVPKEYDKQVKGVLSKLVAEFVRPIILPKIKKEAWGEK